jgi:site-specific DNA-methyltransferase (adenine-specific)
MNQADLIEALQRNDLVVVQADCRKVLPVLPDTCVHLTVTDPPYESLERHRSRGTTTRLKASDASSNPWFETFPNVAYWLLFKELHRIQQDNTHCYVFCDSETEHVILSGRNPYDDESDTRLLNYQIDITARPSKCPDCQDWGLIRPTDTDPPWTVWPPLIWVKTKQGKAWKDGDQLLDDDIRTGMGYHWRRCEERILFLEKGKRKLNELGWKNVQVGPRPGKDEAPAQKPSGIIEKLILNSTAPGELVLDCFCGSGVVGRMALKHGRSAVLIDINLEWCKPDKWPETEGKKVKVIHG